MKLLVRAGLTAAAAVTVAAASASAAVGTENVHVAADTHAVPANPKAIKPAAYNQARSILANAGGPDGGQVAPLVMR